MVAPKPGLLYVTMKPQESLPSDQFHDWYNNEHGPMRLRFPFFKNGFRYRANDLSGPGKGLPEWLAFYDITDMQEMIQQPYVGLRLPPIQSQRERDTMKQIKVDRKFFDFVESREAENFKRLEEVKNEGEGNVLVAVSQDLYPGKAEEYQKWYLEEHIPMLSKIPGWLRTRLYVTAAVENKEQLEYVALHEYAPKNGLDGPEYQAAISTPWRNEVQKTVIKEKRRRTYDLYYTIGPAQRDLSHIYSPIISTDGKIREFPATETQTAAIESYITTADGVSLPYRLEGNTSPDAPLIVLSNSILVNYNIWDSFISSFLSAPENKKYRIVRYLTRGRSSACGSQAITVDVLASDIIALLDALRVPKAAAVIGVSLGGATALNVGLRFSDRVAAVIACDTSAKSPAGNSKAWGERIAMAQEEGAVEGEEPVVGERLAEITTRRWFVPENYEDATLAKRFEEVKQMVATNSLEGFERSVQALYDYDMTPLLGASTVKAGFLVGARDGVLPGSMRKLAASVGQGAHFAEIEGAGHLPMVEKPREFSEAVAAFLSS